MKVVLVNFEALSWEYKLTR